MKQIATIVLTSLLTLQLAGCSEKDEPITTDSEKGIAIESISAVLQGMESNNGITTRATQQGFSVNTNDDPTKTLPQKRSWKMNFTLYNGSNTYTDGSFSNLACNNEKWTVSSKYFPNYKKPQAEALIYPDKWSSISTDQSTEKGTDLLAQDVLFRDKATIEVAHKVTIEVKHKHSMLDFVIKNVVKDDIQSVQVFVDNTPYTPYAVKATPVNGSTTSYDMEYMLILPQTTNVSPIVQIKTEADTGTGNNIITYKQTIGIIKDSKIELGSNKCYCFTLQGAELKLSPITVLNWATGESLPGEYIAVTAYPTFKVNDLKYAEKTFYFYYDNKLVEKDTDGNTKPKLQKITFNKNAECTIKPDGRILKYIYTESQVEAIKGSKDGNMTPKNNETGTTVDKIILGTMIIDLSSVMPTLP
ncbi:hypothetical protein [Bacteroides sp.]|uniref:hypothetical protein n=1 Tax=Bacteroides sp. TaxID=29523 RepID=UPI0026162A1A|nr:hypothetical protein [Bacteroides sp.]